MRLCRCEEKSPDIRQFLSIHLPQHLQSQDAIDNAAYFNMSINNSLEFLNGKNIGLTRSPDYDNFLPQEVESLCHQAKDVLKRLLEFDAQKRIRSVRALQRIAMYKDFKIEVQYCLKIYPLDIISADNITIKQNHESLGNSLNADKAFNNF